MNILKEIDPEETNMRKARRLRRRKYLSEGPNSYWHADGYDKLKPYGFLIHGCIGVYLRQILWLKVTKSNSHAKVTDCGTENVLMAAIQSRLQASVDAHPYSSTVANVTIENRWPHNRKGYTGWLINFFKDIGATCEFNLGNSLHMELAWYTFSPLLQYELDQVKHQWNTHNIRRTRHDTLPGMPDELFFLPELSGGQNQGTNISDSEIDSAYSEKENLMEDATIIMNDADEELVEYFEYVVREENLLCPPTNWKDGRELFIHILERSSTQ